MARDAGGGAPGATARASRDAPSVAGDRGARLRAPVILLFVASLAATAHFSRSMSGGMAMPGGWTMSMMWMRMPGWSWPATSALFLFVWLVMMMAMMLPSAAPMLARLGAGRAGVLGTCGYFAVWVAAGAALDLLGIGWAAAAMRFAGVSRAAPALGGAMLMAAGLLQFSRFKAAGLSRCRDAACGATARGRREGPWAGFSRGLREGRACVVCCAGPMLALVAVGMMNLGAMAIVATVIALEKLVPAPRAVVLGSGGFALAAGSFLIVRALL